MSGRWVSIQPSFAKIRYIGINVIWLGIIIVPIRTENRGCLPRNLSFENAYAASALVNSVPSALMQKNLEKVGALVNGWLIGKAGAWLEKRFDFRDGLAYRRYFESA